MLDFSSPPLAALPSSHSLTCPFTAYFLAPFALSPSKDLVILRLLSSCLSFSSVASFAGNFYANTLTRPPLPHCLCPNVCPKVWVFKNFIATLILSVQAFRKTAAQGGKTMWWWLLFFHFLCLAPVPVSFPVSIAVSPRGPRLCKFSVCGKHVHNGKKMFFPDKWNCFHASDSWRLSRYLPDFGWTLFWFVQLIKL